MIKLDKNNLFAFIQRAIFDDYKVVATNIKICLKWEQLLHDRPNRHYYMNSNRDWEQFISYQDDHSVKYLTLSDIYMYLDYHYPNNSKIDVSLIVKDNASMYKKENITDEEWEDEWKNLCQLTAKIEFEDEASDLTKEDIRDLISFALDINDRVYFDELVERIKKMDQVENKLK